MWLRAEDGTLVNLMQTHTVKIMPVGDVPSEDKYVVRARGPGFDFGGYPLYLGTKDDCQAVLNAIDKQLAAHNLNLLADTDEKATFGG